MLVIFRRYGIYFRRLTVLVIDTSGTVLMSFLSTEERKRWRRGDMWWLLDYIRHILYINKGARAPRATD